MVRNNNIKDAAQALLDAAGGNACRAVVALSHVISDVHRQPSEHPGQRALAAVAALCEQSDRALDADDVAAALKITRDGARIRLNRAYRMGLIRRESKGRYAKLEGAAVPAPDEFARLLDEGDPT